jgi:acetylornithine/N-succinyldiaminopimelate aminotransferase
MTQLSQREIFFKHQAQTSEFPLAIEIERAQGVYMYGPDGKEYLDLISGIAVSNVGHCHPKVVNAIKEQCEKHMHLMVYGETIQSPQVELTKLLTKHLPENLDSVFLVNSGAEATEGAMKLAKRFTGRSEIVSFKNSYHGSTQGALSLMGDETFKRAFRPLLPDVRILEYNIAEDLEQITDKTACVFAETIQAEAGIIEPKNGFLQKLRQRCTETGALLVLDEIQVGFGRTGKLWAFEHYNVVPDILLLAKGMGGGMPIGAFIANREVMHSLTNSPILGHITTFGGNAVCAAAALAALSVIVDEKLYESAHIKEALFREKLKHPAIKQVRGRGLFLAAEFDSFDQTKKIIDNCLEMGLLTDWFLFADNCLRIAPPLIISDLEIEKACEIIKRAIKKTQN